MNYYEILGVAKDADHDTIKKAYRKLARKYHPDVSEEPDAAERMPDIQRAYDTLVDPAKRAHYDATGDHDLPDYESPAKGLLTALALSWVMQTKDCRGDMVAFIMQHLEQQAVAAQNTVQEGEDLTARLHKAVKRLRYKGTSVNFIHNALEHRITEVEERMKAAHFNVELINFARDLASNYEFEPETFYTPPGAPPVWARLMVFTPGV